jgi:hypothetical protein
LARSLWVSRQAPLHSVSPAVHAQALPPQLWSERQARLQAPQLARSTVRSRQTPAQLVSPVGQLTTQRPAWHACPAPQATPQVPQLAPSVWRSTQRPVHTLCPDGQLSAHTPLPHTCPEAQVVLHAPQLALSLRVFTSQPLAALPSQSAKPAAHAPRAHAPLTQDAPALAKAQRMPQPPQLFASDVLTWVSQPLPDTPSQLAKPARSRR